MKTYMKPVVKAGERFSVIRSGQVSAQVNVQGGASDDVVVSDAGVVPDVTVEADVTSGQVAEFLVGVSLEDGRERVLPVCGPVAGRDFRDGAVGFEVLRELKRGRDVFVSHGVVTREGDVETVTVWSAEVHVMPDRVALLAGAVKKSPLKFAAKMHTLAELAWVKLCGRDGVVTSVVAEQQVAKSAPEDEAQLDLMLMVPERYEDCLM